MNSTINLLEMGLDGAHLRHKTLSNNIANVSTPKYKRKDVNFIEALKSNINKIKKEPGDSNSSSIRLAKTNSNHFNLSASNARLHYNGVNKFKINNYSNTSYRNDQNNVDVDAEMAKLAKNNLYYNTLTQRVAGKFGLLQEVIQKGSE
ncbi:MAG TPA: flagellar basal body rod protein FlgB [Halanaerobiales bacterium]|nr:flagellar basal body rod protein FlgB [Halanaerobiales bacterium]